LKPSNVKHLYLGIWQHSKYFFSIFQGVSFDYHQRNVRHRVSVANFQVWAFMANLGLEVWGRSRSRRLRSILHDWHLGYYFYSVGAIL